jgi:hypothetical protein
MKTGPAGLKAPPASDPIADDPASVVSVALKAFERAARAVVEENDRLGIPSYGGKDGKIVVCYPPKGTP